MRILVRVSKNVATPAPHPGTNRLERILAIMIVALVALALVCFIAVIVATAAGVKSDGFSQGVWPTVFMVPYLGLPLAFLMIVALLVTNGVRRSRAAKGSARGRATPDPMKRTAALAARLRAMDADALASALEGRGVVVTGIRDFFDLADALLETESLQACLTRLDRYTLTALSALGTTRRPAQEAASTLGLDAPAIARLNGHLLLDATEEGIATWTEVVAQLERWPSLGLPAAGDHGDDPAPERASISAEDQENADRLAAERAFAVTSATAELLFELARDPARLLARGGIGQPETRRLAAAAGLEEDSVATLLDVTQRAGLVHVEDGGLHPSDASGAWLGEPTGARWVALAETWAAVLPGDIRRRIVENRNTLWGAGLRDWLAWVYPGGAAWLAERVALRLGEAERIGITGHEILSSAGAALLSGDPARAQQLLGTRLPQPVDKVYLQHDLTAVATGPLEPAIDARLRSMADVDGRAIAAQFRFTSASVGRAVAGGETAASLREFLTSVTLSGVPQPLAYLIEEAASRHGMLRVGSLPPGDPEAVSYVRSEDSALLGTVLVDRNLAALAFRASDMHRIVSRRDRAQVFWALTDARYPVAAEDHNGRITQLRRPATPRAGAAVAKDPFRLLVERLRLADAGAPVDPGQAWLYRQLEAAIRSKETVTVSVRMPGGPLVDYRLEPTSVAGGRLRARDPLSEIERTLPLSSIAAVTPA